MLRAVRSVDILREEVYGMTRACLLEVGQTGFVSVDLVREDPDQPRRHFSAKKLKRLAKSIKSITQLRPALVRLTGDPAEPYELVGGARRLRAIKIGNGADILVRVVASEGRRTQLLQALADNYGYEALTDIDAAHAFKRLTDDGLTPVEIGAAISRPTRYVRDCLALLDMSPAVHECMSPGLPRKQRLTLATVMLLRPLSGEHAKLQGQIARHLSKQGFTHDKAVLYVTRQMARAGIAPARMPRRRSVPDAFAVITRFLRTIRTGSEEVLAVTEPQLVDALTGVGADNIMWVERALDQTIEGLSGVRQAFRRVKARLKPGRQAVAS